jgi:3-hydroxy-9,10-secoandrosta-1,3,5(10)-triene-9,17-dione monooxygenase reductase component
MALEAGTGTDPHHTPDAALFRAACGTFATGVTVVTAHAPTGPQGATVNSFASLSVEPPQVVVCLARTSRTWSAAEAAGAFAVNVLAAEQRDVARLFASGAQDKLARVAWRPGFGGAPVLDGAAAHFECRLAGALRRATHMLLIGEVVHAEHRADAEPLIFFRSRMHEGLGMAAAARAGS